MTALGKTILFSCLVWAVLIWAGIRACDTVKELYYDSQHRQTYHEERRFK